ncbi:helix-turn-helix domain-containing protein [Corynebacterium pilosum]|uniref:HTH family transcriptional regulator n=1 Tax=Corynebacterium pilosum TaxID=35756 RepID=A0A376CKR5_9CORY|nr:HTH family transcriptional regulator [Corynebacterium pilosum]
MTVANRVQTAMSTANMSQSALAEATEISQPSISRILHGRKTPSLDELGQIAEATGQPIYFFLKEEGLPEGVQCAARTSRGSDIRHLEEKLAEYVELDRMLTSYFI